MSKWEIKRWKSVLEIKSGRNQKQVVNPNGRYPIYGSGGLMGYAEDYICDEGTTIIGRKGSINCPIYVTQKFWNVDTAFGLSPLECLNKKFLYYFCLSYDFTKHDKGTTLPSLTKVDLLNNIFIPLPPLSEQKRIVEILDEAFEGIDRAIANTKKNLANARELFDSYLNNIFDQKGTDWVETKLENLCSIKHGFAFKSTFFTNEEDDYVLLTPGSFYEDGGYREQGEKTKYYIGEIPDGYILEENNMLLAMTEQAVGLLGSPLIVPESDRFLHNQRLGLIQVFDDVVWHNYFFFHQFNAKQFRASVQETASGVKVRHTSPKKLCAISVCFPPRISEQKEITNKLNKLQEETQRLKAIYQHKLEALQELKQSLLNKAFTGELTNPTVKEVAA